MPHSFTGGITVSCLDGGLGQEGLPPDAASYHMQSIKRYPVAELMSNCMDCLPDIPFGDGKFHLDLV